MMYTVIITKEYDRIEIKPTSHISEDSLTNKKTFRLAQKSKSSKLILYVNYISIKMKEETKSKSNFITQEALKTVKKMEKDQPSK